MKQKSLLYAAIYFVIAVAVRFFYQCYIETVDTETTSLTVLRLLGWVGGSGPMIGALVCILLFKRKTPQSLKGISLQKSILTWGVPIIAFGIYDIVKGGDSMLCVWLFYLFIYGTLEEYGWRGYLQEELSCLPKWSVPLIITALWFIWHLHTYPNVVSALIFLAILLAGSYGIGIVAKVSHSIMLCAAFHIIANFFRLQWIEHNAATTTLMICSILFWVLLWWGPWTWKKTERSDSHSDELTSLSPKEE